MEIGERRVILIDGIEREEDFRGYLEYVDEWAWSVYSESNIPKGGRWLWVHTPPGEPEPSGLVLVERRGPGYEYILVDRLDGGTDE